ncbi:MAG: hypothetical protein HYZ81_24665 [Nitrospinae bacterium]|nr:hypothetical protein [Nitrospinota bacterium]
MVVTCSFYGFASRVTKVDLLVDKEKLAVGNVFAYGGDNYIILSIFEASGKFHANVALEHVHRARTPPRPRAANAGLLEFDENGSGGNHQESALHARLKATEAKLQHLLHEREEVLSMLERAIQQLDRLHRDEGAP